MKNYVFVSIEDAKIDVEKSHRDLMKRMEDDGSIEVLRDYIKYLAKK